MPPIVGEFFFLTLTAVFGFCAQPPPETACPGTPVRLSGFPVVPYDTMVRMIFGIKKATLFPETTYSSESISVVLRFFLLHTVDYIDAGYSKGYDTRCTKLGYS